MAADTIAFNHILGQGRVNQLGGVFINGRPLPQHIRVKIIEMASKGIKPCHISRQLRVSHGAVSKILNRYAETGSISPGQIGGNPRTRVAIQAVEKQLQMLMEESPNMSGAELREQLIQQGICTRTTAPTIASINRLLKTRSGPKEKKCGGEKKRLSYSIDSILGISIDDCEPSSSEEDGCTSPNEGKRNRTSFTTDQLEKLENAFKNNTYPDGTERENIAKDTGLSEEKIMTWFSNRRARCRKHMPMYPQVYPSPMSMGSVSSTPSSVYSPITPQMFMQGFAGLPLFNAFLATNNTF